MLVGLAKFWLKDIMLSALILFAVVVAGAVLVRPRLANAPLWRATITPLASIIGSGFLVLGPVLDTRYGGYAPLVMLGLCATAWLFGSAIRYTITHGEGIDQGGGLIKALDMVGSVVLAGAYVISVAYYLNLFGAFGVSLTGLDDAFHANLLTSAVFLLILSVGWTRGFAALERMEQVSVGMKLAVIAGLVFGLAVYFGEAATAGTLHFDRPEVTGWSAFAQAAGLIVTVQGFETSRYLGATYDAPMRVRSMRLAQGIATVVYLLYVGLLTYAFRTEPGTLDETAIIAMMQVVAPILPVLLVVAALSAQFSAAIADTSGSGGLMAEVTRGRLAEKPAYAFLVGLGLALTWTANVFEIISYASRAFALYYALQSWIAAAHALRRGQRGRVMLYGAMAVLGLVIAIVGVPVE